MSSKSVAKAGGFLSPKAISNRIKAKGLQKLRWYCQMCQKSVSRPARLFPAHPKTKLTDVCGGARLTHHQSTLPRWTVP